LAIYTDACILAAKHSQKLDEAVKELPGKFKCTDEGHIDKYLGVKFKNHYKLSQLLLILSALRINKHTKTKDILALSSKYRDADGPSHDTRWDYRQIWVS